MTPERRRQLLVALAALVAVVAAFLVGRSSAPTRVEEKVRVQQVEKQVVVVQEKLRVERVEVASASSASRSVRHETRRPDGSVEKTVVTDRQAGVHVATGEGATSERTAAAASEHASELATSKTVTSSRPRWRAGALLGTRATELHVTPAAPFVAPLAVGAEGQVRLLGPFWLGGYVFSDLAFGLSASVEF